MASPEIFVGADVRDLTGTKVGRWLIVDYAGKKRNRPHWLCKCNCGSEKAVSQASLISRSSLSCGCLRNERVSKHRSIDLSGQKFGRLVVQSVREIVNNRTKWVCECVCGNRTMVEYGNLVSGRTASCGCLFRESLAEGRNSIHKMSTSVEYSAWRNMKQRCENPGSPSFAEYGGRGVTIAEQWSSSFEQFFKDLGFRPSPKHRIERFPDEHGPFSPDNCRWGIKKRK